MPATTDTLLPPRYESVRPLAHGGMGEIYRARDRELGRDVAVKVLSARYAGDEGPRGRFRREALAAARLSSNPHIVTIFDVGEHNGRPIIVMEYVGGGSLERQLAAGRPCDPAQALDWLDDAANALDAAHAAGVVHRDVKPGNLLLDETSRVKVADFGIASAAGLESFTKTGTVLGTAGYLSPEQGRGERAGPASDRYALGVVAYELLTGRRPFERDSPTAEAAAHATAPVPSVHAANPALPPSLDAVFERALAKEPSARYPTAAEFVGDLRRALRDAAEETWPSRAVVPPLTQGAAPPAPRRWWIPLLAAMLIAAGVVAAVLGLRGGSNESAPPRATTIVRTVTSPGTTVQQTVTAPAPTTSTPPTATSSPTTSPAPASSSGAALNDAGYAKMRAGDYNGALPLLEQAVQKLTGSGSIVEAFADFNLAYTRFALGQCTDVVALLDRSESIQGHRVEIDRLRKDARKACK